MRSAADTSENDAEGSQAIVRSPRREVLARFRYFLQESKTPYFVLDAKKTKGRSEKAALSRPDLIVADEPNNLLVTVRRSLCAEDSEGIEEWLKTFGPGFEAIRVWPVETDGGWEWVRHRINHDEQTSDL